MHAPNRLDELIAELWQRVRQEHKQLSQTLAEAFKQRPWLKELDREEIVRTLHGMLQHDRRLDFALESGGTRVPQSGRAGEWRLWAWRVLEDGTSPQQAEAACKGPDWKKVAKADDAIAARPEPAEALGLRHSLPDFVARRLLEAYGSREAEKLATALADRPPLTLRINALKASREDLLQDLKAAKLPAQPTPYARHGLELLRWFDVFSTPHFQEGLLELQDESSQLVAELVAPAPRTLVVDYCAGAGGKTLALGALMHNRGKLVALDPSRARLQELRRRATRAGLDNLQALELPSAAAAPLPLEIAAFKGKAARVLVDAPCTGLGVLRRKPEPRWRLKEEDIGRLAQKQVALARRAMELVLPHGRLIYATCSLLPEENEQVVEALLENEDFSLVPIKEILGGAQAAEIADASGRYLKMLPHRHESDGFFAAVLRRKKA